MRRPALLLTAALAVTAAVPARAADDYVLGPDSQPTEGIPHGILQKFPFTHSGVFPGTERDYWVYVPAQYDATRAAALMVFFDGWTYANPAGSFRAPVVLDNLIHKKEVPVTIGVFINPGNVPAAETGGKPRGNRSFEYDSLGDLNARFVLNEILPAVAKRWNITREPVGRVAVGISSGGIAAFTLAWERPDQFSKVLSHVGSFTNIRGGNVYPSLIRKTERKRIRVFLQDGSGDLDNLHGNWPLANQEMAAALKFMGYDHKFEMGDGGHNGKQGGAILPDSLRWLWRGYMP